MLHGAQADVLGVVHGVQPVLGAAAAYWRMKAGFERLRRGDWATAWVLGRNQEQVTSLLGFMQGGLELLPNRLYTANGGTPGEGGWLEIRGRGTVERRPQTGDPYGEIYLQREARHRLITAENLRPGWLVAARAIETAWTRYCRYVAGARAFHDRLATNPQHPETHAFYGTGRDQPTADRIVFTLSRWVQTGQGADGGPEPEPRAGSEYSGGGAYHMWVREHGAIHEMRLEQQEGGGDGTVPESSGGALRPSGRSQPAPAPTTARAFAGIAHSSAYESGAGEGPSGDTIDFVMEAVGNLCRMRAKG